MSERAEAPTWDWLAFDEADRLRRALRLSDVSVQDMADELRVGRNTIGRYINGHSKPSRATLIAWAMKTGVPIEWLETGELPRLDSNQRPFVPRFTQVSTPANEQIGTVVALPEPSPRTTPRTTGPGRADDRPAPVPQATTTATASVGGAVVVDLATFRRGRRAGTRQTSRRPA